MPSAVLAAPKSSILAKSSVQHISHKLRRIIEGTLLLGGLGVLAWRGLRPWVDVRKDFVFMEASFLWVMAYLMLKGTE